MNTLRFNPFHQVHQALRALLYHVSITVQHTDFTNIDETEKTITLIEETIVFFEGHAHIEDTRLFPMIAAVAPMLVADFEEQHVRDHQLGEELAQSIDQYRAAATSGERQLAGQKLQIHFTEFTAFNLTHMNQEETIVLTALWENYTDEELHAKHIEIMASQPQEKKRLAGYWMLKGLAIHEIINWYKSIRATAPSYVFDEFLLLAESALSADKLSRLQKSLQLSLA